jgi:DNA primase
MSDTQTIKDRIDIVQLIQEYIPLKKSGVNWKGCCPFHQEKTPSFMVHPDRQFYHCFGCAKGGDIFSFVQEMEGLEFVEALKLLADRAGVKVDTFKIEINKSQKNRILEINKKAAYFFHKFLTEMDAAKNAKKYLEDRQIKSEIIKEWQVGYIPDQWDLLIKYLLKSGFGIEDIVSAGLAIKKDNANAATGRGYYDRFRGRVMFPIWSIHGDVVGFTGRVLVETENSGGKYVNTPQTLVFDKSRVIFGLNKAKTEIRSSDSVVLVEGQMDVIACSQAGMKNVVAASGTALTLEHIKLLKRYTNNLAMAFDADAAGVKAAKRGIDVALQEGMNIKVIQIPEGCGKDADECIKHSTQIWFKAVTDAVSIMDWYFSINLDNLDLKDPKAKQKAGENILLEIAQIPYAIEREHWLKELSSRIDIGVESLKNELARLVKQVRNNSFNKVEPKPEIKEVNEVKDRYLMDLEGLWALLIKFPILYTENVNELKQEFFVYTWLNAIYEIAKKQYTKDSKIDLREIENQLEESVIYKYNVLLMQAEEFFAEMSDKDSKRAIVLVLDRIKEEHKKRKIQKLINNQK